MDNLNYQNGRVKILGSQQKNQFDLYDKIPVSDNSSFRDALTGSWETSELSNTYFSSQNIQTLQNGIRQGVYDKSNGIYMIGEQDVDTLQSYNEKYFLSTFSTFIRQYYGSGSRAKQISFRLLCTTSLWRSRRLYEI